MGEELFDRVEKVFRIGYLMVSETYVFPSNSPSTKDSISS